MFARILKSGTFHDVVGYVTRQFFHAPAKEYNPETHMAHHRKRYIFRLRPCENGSVV